MQNRIERFSKIRTWLDGAYAQKPSPHQILNQMLVVEQVLNLRLLLTEKPWTLISSVITTVAGQSTYEIVQPVSGHQNSGKVHFIVRSTGNNDLPSLPVPFDDFCSLNYGKMPPAGEVNAGLIVPEKVSFYRTDMQDQKINAVIEPVPQEVLTYTVWFFAGALDRSDALMTSTAAIIELADYLDLKTAFTLLPYSEWRDDDVFNDTKRKSLGQALAAQIAELEPIVAEYISNINSPETFDMDHWDE